MAQDASYSEFIDVQPLRKGRIPRLPIHVAWPLSGEALGTPGHAREGGDEGDKFSAWVPAEAPLSTDDGRPFWPVFVNAETGEPVDPWTVLARLHEGTVTFELHDHDELGMAVEDLKARTRMTTIVAPPGVPESRPYEDVVSEYDRQRYARAYARLLDLQPPPTPERWLTVSEVAELLECSIPTVYRWSGQRFAAPRVIDGVKMWRLEPLLAFAKRAAKVA